MPFRKADDFTMTSTDAVHEYFLSIAISLCNKIITVCVCMVGFCKSGYIRKLFTTKGIRLDCYCYGHAGMPALHILYKDN